MARYDEGPRRADQVGLDGRCKHRKRGLNVCATLSKRSVNVTYPDYGLCLHPALPENLRSMGAERTSGEKPRRQAAVLFGAMLRDERLRQGLSQEALAERAGLHPTYVSMLERGLRQPSLETLLRLGGALGVSATDFVAAVETVWEPEP
jgi:plasmid maintenance system antidote protein VapI